MQSLELFIYFPVASEDDTTRKEEIKGQGYFLRAFYYHQLYSLYGRVPLIYHTRDIDYAKKSHV